MWYGNPDGRRACKVAQDRLNVVNNDGELVSNSTEVDKVLNENNNKKLKIDSEKVECKTITSAIDVPATEAEIEKRISTAVQAEEEPIHAFIERTCVWCARQRSVPGADRAMLEFAIRSPGIWLHALQYSFPLNDASKDGETCCGDDIIKSFRADLPEWHDF